MEKKYTPRQSREIGARVRNMREKRGMSSETLCKKAGFPFTEAIVSLEKGAYIPCDSRLQGLAKALKVTVKYLISGEAENKGEEMQEHPAALPPKRYIPNGAAIKSLREKENLTQKDIAALCSVCLSLPGMWEHERATISEEARILAKRFGVPVETLVKTERPKFLWADGAKLREHRENTGLSKKDIAELCGVSCSMADSWEEAGLHRFNFKNAENLSDLFDVRWEELFSTDHPREPKVKKDKSTKAAAKAAALSVVKNAVAAETSQAPAPVPDTAGKASRKNQEADPQDKSTGAAHPARQVKEADNKGPADRQEGLNTRKGPSAAPAVPAHERPENKEKEEEKELPGIPETPEEIFCRNILFYFRKKGCTKEEFENAVGCPIEFFKDVIKFKIKLKMEILLRAAGFFGMTMEEVVYDDSLAKARSELSDLKEKIRFLSKLVVA